MLSEKTRQYIVALQKRYPQKRSALIPALHKVQAEQGYLSLETQREVAALFDLAPSEVHSVVTFYDMFFEHPVGKHLIRVCKNACCLLRGGDSLLESLCKKLHVEPGGTTRDGEFTVIPSECLAACDKAPMLLIDDEVYGPVKEEDLEGLLESAKKRPGFPCPLTMEGDHG